MTDNEIKQAITGFSEFFKAITGNQNLEIPKDMAEKYGIQINKDKESIADEKGEE